MICLVASPSVGSKTTYTKYCALPGGTTISGQYSKLVLLQSTKIWLVGTTFTKYNDLLAPSSVGRARRKASSHDPCTLGWAMAPPPHKRSKPSKNASLVAFLLCSFHNFVSQDSNIKICRHSLSTHVVTTLGSGKF